jgi:hypothetical protein
LLAKRTQISGVPNFRDSFPRRGGRRGRGGIGERGSLRKRMSGDVFEEEELEDIGSLWLLGDQPPDIVPPRMPGLPTPSPVPVAAHRI